MKPDTKIYSAEPDFNFSDSVYPSQPRKIGIKEFSEIFCGVHIPSLDHIPFSLTVGGTVTDFMPGDLREFVINAKTRSILESSDLTGFEFVPITVDGERDRFWFLNVVSVVDCLDVEKTNILYSSDDPKRILNLTKPVFRDDVSVKTDFLKIPHDPHRIFVKRTVVDLVLEHQLTGIMFEDPATRSIMAPKPLFGTPIRPEKKAKSKPGSKIPSIEELKELGSESLYDKNVLSDYIFKVINKARGGSFDAKVKYAVEEVLPPKVSDIYFCTNFVGLWGNGGMQAVLLCDPDEIPFKQWELRKTADACKTFGCPKMSEFIESLIPKSKKWSEAIGELTEREDDGEEIAEEDFEKIWAEVDTYDEPFDQGFDDEPYIYEAIAEDIRSNPEKYLPKP